MQTWGPCCFAIPVMIIYFWFNTSNIYLSITTYEVCIYNVVYTLKMFLNSGKDVCKCNWAERNQETKGQWQNPSHECESMQDMGCIKIALTRRDICMEIIARSSSEPTFFGDHGLLTNFLVVLCMSHAFKSVKAYIVQVCSSCQVQLPQYFSCSIIA
jgi:hypothetical protein